MGKKAEPSPCAAQAVREESSLLEKKGPTGAPCRPGPSQKKKEKGEKSATGRCRDGLVITPFGNAAPTSSKGRTMGGILSLRRKEGEKGEREGRERPRITVKKSACASKTKNLENRKKLPA